MIIVKIKERIKLILRWSEKYTRTDMVYLAQGGFWLSFMTIIVSIISFIKMIILGRFLPQEIYGVYGYVIAVSGILSLFSLSGINTSIVKSIVQKKEGTFLLALKTKMKWGFIGSGVSLVLSLWYFLNQNNVLGILFLITAIFLPFIYPFTLFFSYLQGRKEFYKYAKYEIITGIFISLTVIPTIIITNNVIFIILALFLSEFIFYGTITINTIKKIENKEEDKRAISFGKDITLMGAMSVLGENIDKIIIWKLLGPASVATYSFAQMPIYKIINFIPISSLALPKLGEKNIKEIKGTILNKFKKLFLISIPFSFFIMLMAPMLYKILLPQYVDSIPYFQAFAIIIVFLPFGLISSALISDEKRKELYILNSVIPILKIFIFIILTPFFGIWGIIGTVLASKAIENILALYFFNKI